MLVRRRTVWLPTLWGLALLVAVGAALGVLTARSANRFLAPTEPALGAAGRGADTLVVEGWIDEPELAQAVAAIRRGRYARVLTTGGPIEPWGDAGGWKSHATRGAAYLRSHGVDGVPVTALPAPESARERTYESALQVRDWAARAGVSLAAVDVFTAGVHARRSRLLYRMALGDAVEVGVVAARPAGYNAERWWTTSRGAKATLGEALGWGWTVCCFWPDPQLPDGRRPTDPAASVAGR